MPYDRDKDEQITTALPRIEGIIRRVPEEAPRGDISIPPYGQTISFLSRRLRGQRFYDSDEGKAITFNVAFTYDGPVAYDVHLP